MASTKIMSTEWYSLTSAESNVNAIEDANIRANAVEVANILHSIDNYAVGIAYHLHEINTKVKGKEFEKFCAKYFGIKKAQAFNYSTAGKYVTRIFDESGKKSIYIDNFTLALIQKSAKVKNADGTMNWTEYYKAVKKAKGFGMTQILNISACIAKTTLEFDDVVNLIEMGTLSPALSVKRITEYLMGTFKAIEQKDGQTDGQTDEQTDEQTDGQTDEQTDEQTDVQKDVSADGPTIEISVAMLNAIYPELCRYQADAPQIARFVDYLNSKNIMG